MPPAFVIPRGLSTLYRCLLITEAQDKPYHEKPLHRDCCNHKGSCTLFRPYLTIATGINFSSFVQVPTRQLAVSSLSRGISNTLNFHESIGTWWDANSEPLAPKASAVSIELTWLLCYTPVTLNLILWFVWISSLCSHSKIEALDRLDNNRTICHLTKYKIITLYMNPVVKADKYGTMLTKKGQSCRSLNYNVSIYYFFFGKYQVRGVT